MAPERVRLSQESGWHSGEGRKENISERDLFYPRPAPNTPTVGLHKAGLADENCLLGGKDRGSGKSMGLKSDSPGFIHIPVPIFPSEVPLGKLAVLG